MTARNYIFGKKSGGGVNPFEANMVAYYNVNANSNDSTINMHNGTDTSMSYASAGIVNNCASFGGTSRIVIPQSTDFDFSNVTNDIPFTISFWLKPNSASSLSWVMSKRNTPDAQWQINTNGGYLSIALFDIANTANTLTARNNDLLVNGVGNYYTISYDGSGLVSGINIYTNGLVGSGTIGTTAGTYTKMKISNQPMVIGAENFTGSYLFGFNGDLDEISFHKGVAYTQPEALAAYNKLLTGQSLI